MDYTTEELEEMAATTTPPWIEQLRAMSDNEAKLLCIMSGAAVGHGILPEMQARDLNRFYHHTDTWGADSVSYLMMLLSPVPLSVFTAEYKLLTDQGYRIDSEDGWGSESCPHCNGSIGTCPVYQHPTERDAYRFFNICLSCFHVSEWLMWPLPSQVQA